MATPATSSDREIAELLSEIPAAGAQRTAHSEETPRSSSIFQVPSHMRSRDESAYTPGLVYIGPYHQRQLPLAGPYDQRDEMRKQMQDIKLQYLQDLKARATNPQFPCSCFSIVRDRAYEIVGKYTVPIRFDDRQAATADTTDRQSPIYINVKDFVRMMVWDGCFIVEFLIKWYLDEKSQATALKVNLPEVRVDLLRVENQIPFFLLDEFFNAAGPSMLPRFTTIALRYLSDNRYGGRPNQFADDPGDSNVHHHLLHLYQTRCLCLANIQRLRGRPASRWSLSALLARYPRIVNFYRFSVLVSDQALREVLVHVPGSLSTASLILHPLAVDATYEEGGNRVSWIPNAVYLRDTGFSFRKMDSLSKFSNVTRSGRTIKIPTVSPRLTPLSLMKNLVAYEQCQGTNNDAHQLKPFTAFARLLSCLLDTEDDVALLRKCGIIDKRLGSDDKAIVSLFKDLCTDVPLDPDENYLQVGVLNYVKRYYAEQKDLVKLYLWRKSLIPDYFSNPWAVPSIVATAVVLALSILSTFYAIYRYYHPRVPTHSTHT